MSQSSNPKVVTATQGQVVSLVGDKYTLLMTGKETGGAYALIEGEIPPNGGPPPHIHHRETEAFYILAGELEFTVANQTTRLRTGDFIHLPKDKLHAFRNVGGTTARILVQVCPAGLEEFFLEVGHILPRKDAPPSPVTDADMQKLLATAPKYGLEIKL